MRPDRHLNLISSSPFLTVSLAARNSTFCLEALVMPVSVKPLVKPLLLGVYRRYSVGVQRPKFPGVAETSERQGEMYGSVMNPSEQNGPR